jgi:hypothetical protein
MMCDYEAILDSYDTNINLFLIEFGVLILK